MQTLANTSISSPIDPVLKQKTAKAILAKDNHMKIVEMFKNLSADQNIMMANGGTADQGLRLLINKELAM